MKQNTITAIAMFIILGLMEGRADSQKTGPEKSHPGYMMKVSFTPKKEFVIGEPVEVILNIKNVGKNAFTFLRGGRQRGYRDNQFAFSAGTWDRMLPDIGNPSNFGGIGTFVTLEAGKDVSIPIDLKKWFAFDTTGVFSVRGSYLMEFYDPKLDDSPQIWKDSACGEFTVIIKKGEQGGADQPATAPESKPEGKEKLSEGRSQ